MAEIVHFRPKAELNAEQNLRAFVDLCRNELTTFGADLPFDEPIWLVTDSMDLKARNVNTRIIFSNWGTAGASMPTMLPEPFLSLAKAYMRYSHAMRPTTPAPRLMALRALEYALSENGNPSGPSAITSHTLNRAAQLVSARYKPTTAYRLGGQLEVLARFLAEKHLLIAPVTWHSPLKRPDDAVRVGVEFDQRRHEKLPSSVALDALAQIFHCAREPADVLVSSIAAILCSAPNRINEVLRLAADCEVTQEIPSSCQTAYGLRWGTSKGAPPMIKWVVGTMGSVVRDAINNVRKLTEPAREIARWYEENPGEIYLPHHLEHLRKQKSLSLVEARDVLFIEKVEISSMRHWCRGNKVPMAKRDGAMAVALADLERAVLAMLPRGFPIADKEQDLKYSEALCVVQTNVLNAVKGAYRCMIHLVGQGDIADRLGARSTSRAESIFDHFGFTEDDGSPIHIRTHQFRHYLNTLAQAGGLSQLDIAKWSGRIDVRQNNVYDHQSDRDINALVRQVIAGSPPLLPAVLRQRSATLIQRSESGTLNLTAAHTTEYGFCRHDYSLLPCQLHRDCMNCTEQVCIKGDIQKEVYIRRLVIETRALLAGAEQARQEREAGANRWVEHQQLTLSRAEQLCEILDDPQVPPGTAIQLSGIAPASRLEQAMVRRRLKNEQQSHPALTDGTED
jgi:hypothetical protein